MDDFVDLFTERGPTVRDKTPALYADVAVRQRGRPVGTFSYAVPAALRDKVTPGQLAWVPLRERRLPGIVTSVTTRKPDFATKEIVELVDPQPVLTSAQLELGRWMADTYRCSLAESLFAMLPPGLLARTQTLVALTPAGRTRPLEGLTALSRRVMETLRTAEETVNAVALNRLLGRNVGGTLARLARRGWVVITSLTEEPDARPHHEPFLVLTGSSEEIAALRAELHAGRRHSAGARVLEALARAPAGTRDRLPLAREVKARPDAFAALEEAGMVRMIAERRTLSLKATESEVEAFLERRGRRAPQQADLLRQLRDAGGELALDQVTAAPEARRKLEKARFVREERRPARAQLTVLPEVALERAAALRRTARDVRQAALLMRLVEAPDGASPISRLYREVPGAGRQDVQALLAAGVCREAEREVLRDPLAGQDVAPEAPPALTAAQGRVWREIYDAFGQEGPYVFLLHGVTGSGKTEIYLRALGRCLREGRQALVLVPEIGLTPQTVRRFAARFPGRVTVLHSGLTIGERYDQWRRVRAGQVDVVIGPRSALLAPLPRLGLIVVDEEHDGSYKQEDLDPRYHARDTALALARITGSVVILGSATPAVESYARAQRGTYRLLELPERIRVREEGGGRRALVDTSLPAVLLVDMREELRAGHTGMFSRALLRALRDCLAAGEQAILFLNRRGAATFVMCRACGHIVRCPRCEVSFVYHAETERLLCHRCGRQAPSPVVCPECGSNKIRHFGAGTERVVAEVAEAFPQARVLRWDRDATRERGAHEAILDAFTAHRADILVGTQMVAKGLDLPLVTLVGVISADTALHLPDLRSGERTFQLLTQVIGRAGRREERGRAIIQTYQPEHYAVQAAVRQDYAAFFRQELAYRKRYGYPPYRRMARLVYSHSDEARCAQAAQDLAETLQRRVEAVQGARLIGPAPAFVARRRGMYRWQLLLLARDLHALLKGLELPAGWAVDVDPVTLLT
jgi:primosomal protein N' (replication factor Y)